MSSLADIDGIAALSGAEISALLARLEEEERDVSLRRNRVHDRLDFVQAGGFAAAALAEAQLEALRSSEQELSERRHILHRQIDALRAERSRRRSP